MRAGLQHLKGLGEARLKALAAAEIHNLEDLIEFIPRRYLDRTKIIPIAELLEHRESVIKAEIRRVSLLSGRKLRLVVVAGDDSGEIDWVFFHAVQSLQKRLLPGTIWLASGRVQRFGRLQMVHPELDDAQGDLTGPKIVPMYSQPEALRQARIDHRKIRTWVQEALDFPGLKIPEILPESVRNALDFLPRHQCLKILHQPSHFGDISKGKRQLKTEEILPLAVLMAHKKRLCQSRGRSNGKSTELAEKLLQSLPFNLTTGQENAWRKLRKGMQSPSQYQALVQGDVGSGKTAIACLCAALALESPSETRQVALLAPTEILARQLYSKVTEWFGALQISHGLLLGGTNAKERSELTQKLSTGDIRILVGTHALLSPDVIFFDLSLVLVDEQHRFGVDQRQSLLNKGPYPDLVSLSATPIPRTLALTWYGDMELVLLEGKPAGRQAIKTRTVPQAKRSNLIQWALEQIELGERIYWVAPKIEGNEDTENDASVLQLFAEWNQHLPGRCGLLHGKLPETEKNTTLQAFKSGKLPLLVSTTVIEVGVDVPEAGVMVIEGAERFGMSQLHQLRGRVGRGQRAAWCFLLSQNQEAQERLDSFAQTDDGFAIAEMDLEWRGAGNLLGKVQSGQKPFRFFDFVTDQELILELRDLAEALLQDPQADLSQWLQNLLSSPLGEGILLD